MHLLSVLKIQTPSGELRIEEFNTRKAALVFRAINNKTRLQILHLLHHNGNRMTVTSVYKKLRIEQAVASQHLAVLRRNKIVQTLREGRNIYYSIDYERLQEIHEYAQLLTRADH